MEVIEADQTLIQWVARRLVVRPEEYKLLDGNKIVHVTPLTLAINLGKRFAKAVSLTAAEFCEARTRMHAPVGNAIDAFSPLQLLMPLLAMHDQNGALVILDGHKRGERLLKLKLPISALVVAYATAEPFLEPKPQGPAGKALDMTKDHPLVALSKREEYAGSAASLFATNKKGVEDLIDTEGNQPGKKKIKEGRGIRTKIAKKLENLIIVHAIELIDRKEAQLRAEPETRRTKPKFDPVAYLNGLSYEVRRGSYANSFSRAYKISHLTALRRQTEADGAMAEETALIRAKSDPQLIADYIVLTRAYYAARERQSGLLRYFRRLAGGFKLDHAGIVSDLIGEADYETRADLPLPLICSVAEQSGVDLTEFYPELADQKALIGWWAYVHALDCDPSVSLPTLAFAEQLLYWRAVEVAGRSNFLLNAWRDLFNNLRGKSVEFAGAAMTGLDFVTLRGIENLLSISEGQAKEECFELFAAVGHPIFEAAG